MLLGLLHLKHALLLNLDPIYHNAERFTRHSHATERIISTGFLIMSIKLINQQVEVHCLSFLLATSIPSNCSPLTYTLYFSSMLSLLAGLQTITLLQLLTTTTSISVVCCPNIDLMHIFHPSQRHTYPSQPVYKDAAF